MTATIHTMTGFVTVQETGNPYEPETVGRTAYGPFDTEAEARAFMDDFDHVEPAKWTVVPLADRP